MTLERYSGNAGRGKTKRAFRGQRRDRRETGQLLPYPSMKVPPPVDLRKKLESATRKCTGESGNFTFTKTTLGAYRYSSSGVQYSVALNIASKRLGHAFAARILSRMRRTGGATRNVARRGSSGSKESAIARMEFSASRRCASAVW